VVVDVEVEVEVVEVFEVEVEAEVEVVEDVAVKVEVVCAVVESEFELVCGEDSTGEEEFNFCVTNSFVEEIKVESADDDSLVADEAGCESLFKTASVNRFLFQMVFLELLIQFG